MESVVYFLSLHAKITQNKMKKKINTILSVATVIAAALTTVSCNNKKFQVNGVITNAKDSVLYFENMGLNGPEVTDSVILGEDGKFTFCADAPDAPEFYRLRIARQAINIAIDSTEVISVKAAYPTMASQYEITGSKECEKIKELALMQMGLQAQINTIAQNPTIGIKAVEDSVSRIIETYKNYVKINYIFKEPMKAYAYYALFQTSQLGYNQSLIFNPRSNKEDVQVFAAVATSWDTYYPNAERGKNLHNIAIEGMKNIRIIENKIAQAQQIDPNKIDETGILNISLQDNKGQVRNLTDLKGKVVLLDFHLFAGENSTKRIMMLRELYNKYQAQGFTIYQVSVDPDEHFWKTSTAALPWTCVRETGDQSLVRYNVQSIPTFFLLDRNGTPQKRDVQIKDLDSEIKSLL